MNEELDYESYSSCSSWETVQSVTSNHIIYSNTSNHRTNASLTPVESDKNEVNCNPEENVVDSEPELKADMGLDKVKIKYYSFSCKIQQNLQFSNKIPHDQFYSGNSRAE